ncbi:amidohydrolase family protein [Ferrimonas balearica]|uniref:amidohydrolase family protein n=1 Tax=Ferrimonas balearica TaxID=44012 RepID=UPI001C98EF9F|nr:amidohydrolase family protein [Ferrimonas balearica]MBY5991366.1 amidohydrolase family protein [Ferrimonas balearica]
MFKPNPITTIIALTTVLMVPASAFAQTYDLVIENGRVMDPETRYDQVSNVGIIDDTIVTITREPLKGKKVIDATGQVVAPGFIDTHWHWPRELGYKMGLRDGMTTVMDLEVGCAGSRIDDWYADRQGKTQANYGCGVSHEMARAKVLDNQPEDKLYDVISLFETRRASNWAQGVPSEEQLRQIAQEVDAGMKAGGINLASTVGYMREGVTSKEMYEMQRVAADYGRHSGAHTRFTPDTATNENLGAMEVVLNALSLDAPVSLLHFNNPGWQLAQEMMVNLREKGVNIWGEIYPYAAGATAVNAVFLTPENWVERLGHRYEDTLFDPERNEFYTLERYQEDMKNNPTKAVLVFKAPEEDAVRWISLKGVTMASDGMPMMPVDGEWDTPWDEIQNGHPRTSGARASTLRLARENGVPLMDTLAILSFNSAYHLGLAGLEDMQVRGRIQEGMIADIVVFDPNTVTDNSTYTNATVPSTGFLAVLVSGVETVRNDKVIKDARAGQSIRFAPVDESQYQPQSTGEWKKKYTVAPDQVDFSDVNGNQ